MKRQRLGKPKNIQETPTRNSLSDRYAEVVRLRQAVCRIQAALQASDGADRLVSK